MYFATVELETPPRHGVNMSSILPSMAFGLLSGRVLMCGQERDTGPWYILLETGDGLEYVCLHKVCGEWVLESIQESITFGPCRA